MADNLLLGTFIFSNIFASTISGDLHIAVKIDKSVAL